MSGFVNTLVCGYRTVWNYKAITLQKTLCLSVLPAYSKIIFAPESWNQIVEQTATSMERNEHAPARRQLHNQYTYLPINQPTWQNQITALGVQHQAVKKLTGKIRAIIRTAGNLKGNWRNGSLECWSIYSNPRFELTLDSDCCAQAPMITPCTIDAIEMSVFAFEYFTPFAGRMSRRLIKFSQGIFNTLAGFD